MHGREARLAMSASMAMKPASVAAVIPAYNSLHLIRRALDSILRQTRPVQEIIVVDDGSTDDTANVVAEYSGVRYIYQKNAGVSVARNTAIQAAQSEWIAFLDQDDEWLPNKIERMTAAAGESECGVVYSDYWSDRSGSRTLARCISADRLWPSIRYRNPFVPTALMIRRDILLESGGFRPLAHGASAEDWELTVRLARVTKFVHIPEPLSVYYVHSGMASGDERRFLADILSIADTTLIMGLSGPSRWICRQRLRCTAYTFAAIAARDNGRPAAGYVWRALAAWPWPDHEPRKYWLLASLLKRVLDPRTRRRPAAR